MFEGKRILITGGTGSFGKAVLRKLLSTDILEIRILSRDEKKQEDMRLELNSNKVQFVIGDVRDYGSVDEAVTGIDYIFHAAALKQVPSCEFHPMEAVKTNVIGAENVLNASLKHDVRKCIVLSTDKAVYPINAMGLSKALMEKLMLAKSRVSNGSNTILCATRYGNVMASRGSVIPLFLNQILRGEKLTVTDPDMTRFLMSLEESVNLVLYAFEHAVSGDIYVQKSPAATIETLVLALKRLLKADNPVEVIGTRHGEKRYETLISREEMVRTVDLGSFYRIQSDSRDINYDEYFTEGRVEISSLDDYTSDNTHRLNVREVEKTLKKLEVVQQALVGI